MIDLQITVRAVNHYTFMPKIVKYQQVMTMLTGILFELNEYRKTRN